MATTLEQRLATKVGAVALKNPLIAAPAEHFIESDGVRRHYRNINL